MKRSIWTRILAMLLIVSMLTVPVSAAGWNSRSNTNGWGWGNFWGNFWGNIWGGFWGGYEEEEPEPTDPATEPEAEPEAELVLVEDSSTVDNGELLRATTFALTRDTTEAETGTTVKYFPVTMYDYNTATINAATMLKDTGSNEWEGLYFSGGSPAGTNEVDRSNFVAGQYYIQNIRAAANNVNSWISYYVADNGMKMIRAESKENATPWTLEVENGRYYLSTIVDGTKLYLTMVGTGADGDTFTEEKTEITISAFSGNSAGVQLSRNEAYLCQWGAPDQIYYGGWTNNDGGNGMRFYAVDADGNVSDIPTTLGGIDVHTDLTWAQVQAGTYYADGACTKLVTVEAIGETSSEWEAVTLTAANDAYVEFPEYADGNYYYKNGDNYEVIAGLSTMYGGWYIYYGESGEGYAYEDGYELTIYTKVGGASSYTLTAGGETLATLNGTDTSAQVGVTLYTPGTVTQYTKPYAAHNHWNKGSDTAKYEGNLNGDLIYTGLVQSQMVDDQIVFNVPEGGIFNNDTSVKAIYEYVGLPFVLKDDGVYSFDSDANGAYFADTNGDGKSDPQSGSIDGSGNITAYNLKFDEGNTQPLGFSVGDKSTNAFFPYNIYSTDDSGNKTYNQAIDYHFGMRADLPFSMTPNGRIKSTDNESTPITFTFSGDDDVWVFIDGHLVIDLGGIHNRLDATIDFANNTITYSEENGQDTNTFTSSYNDDSFSTTQQLFTTADGTGVIPMTRDAFALDPDHEMQVFYLERGEGTSNCRIEFNLPMNDTVLVTKNVTESWNSTTNKEEDLTDSEQAVINEMDFGFTLYKKEAGAETFSAVTNTNFYLVGRGVEGTVINSTDGNGRFTLKNGQSAKFITEIPTEGVTYYVVEDQVPKGFVSPDFNFAGEATYDYTYTGITASDDDTSTTNTVSGTASAADASQIGKQVIPMPTENADGSLTWAENKSYEVTVKGSIEANDSIEFICSNYMDATLPNPSVYAMEDIIVIDYGLPVQIDPLVNDLYRGDTMEILYVGGADVTLSTESNSDGLVTGTWTEDNDLNFGTVELVEGTPTTTDASRDTFVYTLDEQLTEVEVLTYIVKVTGTAENAVGEMMENNAYSLGKVYIVPATVMYYEENFSDLITFTNGTGRAWDANATTDDSAVSPYQEPGVVGTTSDSTYGTDVAYLNDSGDSNGTSRHADTTNGALQFSYTFTGTGTSFFARTSATTGYMQVKLYEGAGTSGKCISLIYRDTYYKDTNGTDEDSTGTLYNIPVYTQEDLDYGTYTVVCTIAKAGTKGAGAYNEETKYNESGKDFYLDGIRIVQPLNESNETVVNAETGETITDKALGAYATDGEANVNIVTLRQKIITDAQLEDNWNFVVLTDTNGEITTAEEYTSIGPKEEVYLMPGQSVSFAIKYWHNDGYLLHLGMKAPFGTAGAQVGQNTFELKNATDCYYNITNMQSSVVSETDEDGYSYFVATYTISATDKIVSLTNLKATGNYEFVLIEDTNVDVDGSSGEGGDTNVDVEG